MLPKWWHFLLGIFFKNGTTANLICDTRIDARIYGFRNTWSMKMEMHFEKRGDNWYPVNAIATSN